MPGRVRALLLLAPLVLALSVLVDTPFHALWGSQSLGVFHVQARPAFSLASFWEGGFQRELEAWFEQQLASKAVMVRTDNTLSLVLFKEISPHSGSTILLGKHHTLFELSYINNLNSVSELKGDIPPKSPDSVAESTRLMGRASRAFRSLGIDFMMVFYPSKVAALRQRVRPSFLLPGGAERADAGYRSLLSGLRAEGVPVVDAAALFAQIAHDRPDFPLYNSGGLHWSYAGACEASRLILEQMPLANRGGSVLRCELGPSSTADGVDADLADLINVWDNSRFLDQLPQVTASLSEPLAGGPRDALIVGTSFSEHLAYELRQARVFRDVKRVPYYRHAVAANIRWQHDVLRRIVIFEQWQWSYLTINQTEFLEDLIAHSPRFAKAFRNADAEAPDLPHQVDAERSDSPNP